MELSIIVPSLRPNRLKTFLKSVDDYTYDVNYEVLVNKDHGILYEIINKEFSKTKGKYVVLACDDSIVHENWARNMIDFMEESPSNTVGSFYIGSEIKYFGLLCAIFPCVRKEEVIDYFIDTKLKRFYGDIDLSLRFWKRGGQVKTCEDAKITILKNRDQIKKDALTNYFKSDDREFYKKWKYDDFILSRN